MSDCDCLKNIKKSEPTVDDVRKSIGDGMLIATVATMTAIMFFGLRVVGVRQDNALSTSTSLVYLLSFF